MAFTPPSPDTLVEDDFIPPSPDDLIPETETPPKQSGAAWDAWTGEVSPELKATAPWLFPPKPTAPPRSLAPVTAEAVSAITPEGKPLLPGTPIPEPPPVVPVQPTYPSGFPGGLAGEMTDEELEENVKTALDQYSQQTRKITERNPILEALHFTPDQMPSGEDISRAFGIPKAIGMPVSTAEKLLSGFVGFLGSTSGASQAALAEIAPLKPLLFAKWSHDIAASGGEQAANFWESLKRGDMQGAMDSGGTVVADALMLFGGKVPGIKRVPGLVETGVRSVPKAVKAIRPKITPEVSPPAEPAPVRVQQSIAKELGVEDVGTSMGRDHYQFPTSKTEAGMEMDRVQVPAGSSIDVVRAAIETRKAQVAKDFSKEETASPMDFTPSLKTKEGKIIEGTPGGVHDDIYKAQGPLAGAELTLEEPEHGFLYKGEFKSREQASKLLGETEPLRSERLNELRKQHLAKQAAAAQEPVSAGQLGGGAAELGEVGTGEGADIMGVRQVTREAQAKAGQPVVSQPGEGITTENSLDRGRKLLASDPAAADVALEEFDKTGRLSERDFGVARAKYEQVMEQGRRIEEKFGTDSPEYHAARMEALKWSDLTKRMQTEWHKQGMAQQGQTDIDTGNLMDLETARKTDTGKDFTPDQRKQAKKVAANSKAANVAADQARQKLYSEVAQTKSLAKAERDALAAASRTVRESAIRVAEAENKARVAAAGRAKEVADIEVKAAQKALKSAQNRARQAAVKLAKAEQKRMSDPAADLWERAKKYIDSGMDNFDDIRNKLATDTGMPVDRVTKLLTETKRAKYLADDMWRKQQIARQVRTQAKIWLENLDTPFYQKAIASVPKILFGLKVGFHGSVALGTHAPMVAFQPKFWKLYVRDFGKMYKLIGNPAYYERQIQDLQRRPNYITANRSGLVNDPFVYEDYNSPDTAKYFGRLSGMGNRGYSILKILRQDMFDQHWNQLPRTAQIPEVAQALADGINHATGVVKGRAPRGTNIVFFAPRLEGSRVMWLAADPIRAANTFINWKKANPGEKTFAINQVKEKAWVMGTMLSMLALNQGVLSAIGSKQKINFDDPFRSDFLKFKAAGMNMGYGNAMLAMARLPVRLYRIRERKTGRFKNLIYPDEDTYSVLGSYARSQLSPFAGLATELWLKADYENRPLPSSTRPVPKRLAERGVKPYTWAEFWSEQLTPIPVQEALKEVWEKGLGMNPEQIHQAEKAMATIAVMGATGARFTEDYPVRPRPMPRTFKEALEQE